MKSLKGQEFSWLYINTIHLFRVEKSTTRVRNKKIKSLSPSSQPKSLQLPPGNYLRNKQVLIHISAVGREFCIAASTVPAVLTTVLCYTDTSQRRNSETESGHTSKDVASWESPWYKPGRCSLENHSPHKKLLIESIKWLVPWMEMVLENHGMAGYA